MARRYLNLHTPSCGFGAFLRALEETGDEELARSAPASTSSPRAEDAGAVYVLPGDAVLDLTGELTCDWREGDGW
jgi:hypothetical protein